MMGICPELKKITVEKHNKTNKTVYLKVFFDIFAILAKV